MYPPHKTSSKYEKPRNSLRNKSIPLTKDWTHFLFGKVCPFICKVSKDDDCLKSRTLEIQTKGTKTAIRKLRLI